MANRGAFGGGYRRGLSRRRWLLLGAGRNRPTGRRGRYSFPRGCRENPGRALPIASKRGCEIGHLIPSHDHGRSGRRASGWLSRALPGPWTKILETALSDSHRECRSLGGRCSPCTKAALTRTPFAARATDTHAAAPRQLICGQTSRLVSRRGHDPSAPDAIASCGSLEMSPPRRAGASSPRSDRLPLYVRKPGSQQARPWSVASDVSRSLRRGRRR